MAPAVQQANDALGIPLSGYSKTRCKELQPFTQSRTRAHSVDLRACACARARARVCLCVCVCVCVCVCTGCLFVRISDCLGGCILKHVASVSFCDWREIFTIILKKIFF